MNNSDFLFHIQSLKCNYLKQNKDDKDSILEIEDLVIPRGKLIFLLGPSGSGKSTFLEALGLMNKTHINGSKIIFKENEDSNPMSLLDCWEEEKKLDNIRKQHYSFIFQSTNLMSNFSARENCYLSALIQEADIEQINERVTHLLTNLNMPDKLIHGDCKVSELSGGQRQRLAFLSSMASNYTVLFGDEPTGNLDPINALRVMQLIKKSIDKNVTAIIVSHDIKLALKLADMIICLKEIKITDNQSCGEIKSPEQSLYKSMEGWINGSNQLISNVEDEIIKYF